MSSQKTEHYELNQWLATDQVLRTDFNADNAKIDAVLQNQTSNLSALSELVTAHTAALAQKGNCQIYYAAYTGDGQTTRAFSFHRRPWLVILHGGHYTCFALYGGSEANTFSTNGSGAYGTASWSGTSVTFTFPATYYLCNDQGRSFAMVALIPADV